MTTWDGTSPVVWDTAHLRVAADAAGVALWSWNVDTDEIAMDERSHQLWGVPKKGRVTFEELSAQIHPEDLDRVRSSFQATRAIFGAYDIDFRIQYGNETRWIAARGRGDDMGIIGRIMFGIFLDVTERKRSEELHEMQAWEMSHRIKNLFALTAALSMIASRSTDTSAEMAADLSRRLAALGVAQDLVRPTLGSTISRAAPLTELFALLLAPYSEESAGRIAINLPALPVGETAATAIALIVHELATNSIKYGALSSASGRLDVSGTANQDDLVIVWREQGGPTIDAPPERRGFGSKLVARTISGQLNGAIDTEWKHEGVVVTLRMNQARLAT